MQHLDEGTIHSWLDGALSADEAARVEAHVKECPQCAAAVAEARGFIAAASRILTALDNAPRGVTPMAAPKKRFDPIVWRVAATLLVVAAGTLVVVRNRGSNDQPMSAPADRISVSSPLGDDQPSAAEPVPVAAGIAGVPAAKATSKAATTIAGPIALSGKTSDQDSRSRIRSAASNKVLEKRDITAGQTAAPSQVAQTGAPAASTLAAPSVVGGGLAALDGAREPELLKEVGHPRRLGAKVTLYEVAPGDTVTLTEAIPLDLSEVVVTGATTVPLARQATGKAAAAPSKMRVDTAVTTSTADAQRAAGVPSPAPVASAPAPTSQMGMVNSLRTITWADQTTGHTLALTGRMSEARLQQIKIRIERERAAAAAKKKP
jgi:anti-sigma factor RsiW